MIVPQGIYFKYMRPFYDPDLQVRQVRVWSPPPATTHPSINPHFAHKARRKNRKAPASPHPRAGGVRPGGAPGQIEDEGAKGEWKKDRGWNSLISSPQSTQRPQRNMLSWLCVLCGVLYHMSPGHSHP
jgi:hypothetical protein